jgi:hypothetical protein
MGGSESEMTQPKFEHDCDSCKFLDHYMGCDLYLCDGRKGRAPYRSLIARHSDEPSDYSSGPEYHYPPTSPTCPGVSPMGMCAYLAAKVQKPWRMRLRNWLKEHGVTHGYYEDKRERWDMAITHLFGIADALAFFVTLGAADTSWRLKWMMRNVNDN